MKKVQKIAVTLVIGLLSFTVLAQDNKEKHYLVSVDDICSAVPLLCAVGTTSNGSGRSPKGPPPKNLK
ncbi:hypothetical protein [Salinimonas sediminis]|uniref:Uncharacterized protein n=1 Tax=Salinimonas sediminis TaxID=2303538 RepID=A0A346NN40_9ALTE|nr:hypothetical protein [Salinimonas sediminis]AXR06947.1 hypothetical protein D0Y50_11640 [Salinimonas sediminis]